MIFASIAEFTYFSLTSSCGCRSSAKRRTNKQSSISFRENIGKFLSDEFFCECRLTLSFFSRYRILSGTVGGVSTVILLHSRRFLYSFVGANTLDRYYRCALIRVSTRLDNGKMNYWSTGG